MQGIKFTLKAVISEIEELQHIFEQVRELEKIYGANCISIEVEIIAK